MSSVEYQHRNSHFNKASYQKLLTLAKVATDVWIQRAHSSFVHQHSLAMQIEDTSPPTSVLSTPASTLFSSPLISTVISDAVYDDNTIPSYSRKGNIIGSTPHPLYSSVPFHRIFIPFEDIPLKFPEHIAKLSNQYMMHLHQGKQRFPSHRYMFDTTPDIEGHFRELNVLSLASGDFYDCWTGPVVALSGINIYCHPEQEFRGAVWRLYPPNTCLKVHVTRGTVFHIGDICSHQIKYMATICRAITDLYALIQLNAYTVSQEKLHPFQHDWPTLTMVIPRQFNRVPIPVSQSGHYLTTLSRELENTVIFPHGFVL